MGVYVPPPGNQVPLSLVAGYVLPAGSVVDFTLGSGAGTTPTSLNVRVGCVYVKGAPTFVPELVAWRKVRASVDVVNDPAWATATPCAADMAIETSSVTRRDTVATPNWLAAHAVTSPWASGWVFVRRNDAASVGAWSASHTLQPPIFRGEWNFPARKDAQAEQPWRKGYLPAAIYDPPPIGGVYVAPSGSDVDFEIDDGYTAPAPLAVTFLLSNAAIDLPPYIALRTDPSPLRSPWGRAALINAVEALLYGHGPRHQPTDPPPTTSPWEGSTSEPPPVPVAQKVYIVMNDVQVVRLPDGAPIEVLSVDLNASIDAWCWSIRMELQNIANLALLKPDGNGPKMVQITMNGYVWTAIIEGWDRSRAFANYGITVTGRSQTALISNTYAATRSMAFNDPYSAQQLANLELSQRALAYTINWNGLDWLVPGGAWYYQDMAPMDVISQIAAARGAVVQSDPSAASLIVQSRYPISPWNWSANNADVALPSDWITNISAKQQSKPMYDAVIISGQSQGILAKVTRTGAAGETFASQVVDQLIVSADVATERGRNILSDRGIQEQVDMDIPLFATGDLTGNMSGLYTPLLLVDVQDPDDPWQGQSVGVTISARRGGPENKALEIWQTLSLERHLSDAH